MKTIKLYTTDEKEVFTKNNRKMTHTDKISTSIEFGDVVVFKFDNCDDIEYVVQNDHLHCGNGNGNRAIFKHLGFSIDEMKDFIKKAYGYAPGRGIWPTSKFEDYGALTRAVNALYDLITKSKKVGSLMIKDYKSTK
ncbi:MAG: hypothetical protein J5I47_08900 [Vicingus serpentipes]|nr:hypothetical protein [Vicingus serpentipes]